MKDKATGKCIFASRGYTKFLEFWHEHYSDLSEAVLIIAHQCPEAWHHPANGDLPQLELGRLLRLLEGTVGEEVMHRLITQPEEAAKDSELCRVAAAKLWEVADASQPRGLTALMEKRRGAPGKADFWAKRDRIVAERRARLAPPETS